MKLKHLLYGHIAAEIGDYVYVVSDLHFNHDKDFIVAKRQGLYNVFHAGSDDALMATAHDYQEYVFAQLESLALSHVARGERVYLINLGDLAINDPKGSIVERYSKLPFTAILNLPGNHHSGLNYHFYKDGVSSLSLNNLRLLGHDMVLKWRGKFYNLSHYPSFIVGVYNGARFSGNLCGHCHGDSEQLNEAGDDCGKVFDCGVDNALRLFGRCYFSLDEVVEILGRKSYSTNPLFAYHGFAPTEDD